MPRRRKSRAPRSPSEFHGGCLPPEVEHMPKDPDAEPQFSPPQGPPPPPPPPSPPPPSPPEFDP